MSHLITNDNSSVNCNTTIVEQIAYIKWGPGGHVVARIMSTDAITTHASKNNNNQSKMKTQSTVRITRSTISTPHNQFKHNDHMAKCERVIHPYLMNIKVKANKLQHCSQHRSVLCSVHVLMSVANGNDCSLFPCSLSAIFPFLEVDAQLSPTQSTYIS